MGARFAVSSRALARQSIRRAVAESLEARRLLAGIVVNTTLDETVSNSTISLREAVTAAEVNAEEDVITFDPFVFDVSSLHQITLSLGELVISSTDNLVIQGPGVDVLALSGNNNNRIFHINGGASVEINGMIMAQGRAESGGAIISSGTLTLTDVTFNGNNAIGADGADGDAVTPAGFGHSAIGGAIYNSGALSITNGTFIENHATGGNGGGAAAGAGVGGVGSGGAIYSDGATITIGDSTFEANSATGGNAGQHSGVLVAVASGEGRGGALSLVDVTTGQINGTSFINNVATGGNGANGAFLRGGNGAEARGGAIYAIVLNFTMNNGSLSNNQAVGGAAGSGADGGAGGTATGGAIYNVSGGSFSNLIFDSNSASGGVAGNGATAFNGGTARGGAMYNDSSINVFSSTFSSNSATGGSGADAPTVGSDGGAGWGGAMFIDGNAVLDTNTYSSNIAQGGASPNAVAGQAAGGAIYNTFNTVNLNNSTVTGNSALVPASGPGKGGAEAFGGAIFGNDPALLIDSSTIDHNTAKGGDGGDGAADQNGGNGGSAFGGGIYGKILFLFNSTVAFNTATGGDGGDGGPTAGNGGNGGNGMGGGIHLPAFGGAEMFSDTVASNSAFNGGAGDGAAGGAAGVSVGGNMFAVPTDTDPQNTLFAKGVADAGPDLFGTFNPVFSLILDTSGATLGGHDNVTGEDPVLGDLKDNGGPTETMLISATGPAHDAGDQDLSDFLEFDQRGSGFPRVIGGEIDIGAVEVGAPIIEVSANGNTILNGDTTPSSLDFTAFGAAKVGTPIDRTFTISNTGVADLKLGTITVPTGFSVLTPFAATVAPGNSTTFTLRFNPGAAGTYSGDVTIDHNETTGAQFVFGINATALGSTIQVNFQPAAAEVPVGYLLDAGVAFGNRGNGYSYGFNQTTTSGTRDRELLSDQLRDTLVHTQLYGSRTWEISVPNGTYQVHLVAGDAKYFDSVYKVNVEGVLTVNGTPTSGNRFIEGTKTIVVSDGKLTITNASGAVNNKLDFLEITPVVTTTKINFQTASSSTPAGYLADAGAVFGSRGNGFSYGWNLSASSFSRDRNNALSPDQRFDTLIHTQLYGNRTWEIAVANGMYQVHLVAGDPSYFDSVYKINVEGVLTVNGTPSSGNRWISGTQTVLVSDGRLTVSNASGAVNNKFAFIEITPV